MPHAFVDLATGVDQLSPAAPLAIDPLADIEVPVGVDVAAETVVDVVLELALVDDVVDLLADTLHSAVEANLPDDELVVARLTELQALVNRSVAVLDDLFELQRA